MQERTTHLQRSPAAARAAGPWTAESSAGEAAGLSKATATGGSGAWASAIGGPPAVGAVAAGLSASFDASVVPAEAVVSGSGIERPGSGAGLICGAAPATVDGGGSGAAGVSTLSGRTSCRGGSKGASGGSRPAMRTGSGSAVASAAGFASSGAADGWRRSPWPRPSAARAGRAAHPPPAAAHAPCARARQAARRPQRAHRAW